MCELIWDKILINTFLTSTYQISLASQTLSVPQLRSLSVVVPRGILKVISAAERKGSGLQIWISWNIRHWKWHQKSYLCAEFPVPCIPVMVVALAAQDRDTGFNSWPLLAT